MVEKRQIGREKAELNSEDDLWIEFDLKTSDGSFLKRQDFVCRSCLAWSSVASETERVIQHDTIEKLGKILDDSVDMKEFLEKLKFYMNDRAANEKKSCDLLDEWKEEMLAAENIPQKAVKHLHCAAHVRLGLHAYVLSSLRKLEVIPGNDQNNLSSHFLETCLMFFFAIVGDYTGLSQRWEGLCMERGIKTVIKLYKDNRFNS